MQSESHEIDVDVALIDVDGTITTPTRKTDFAVPPLEHLLRMVEIVPGTPKRAGAQTD